MKLLDEWEMSEWAYEQCKNGNNTHEIKKLITHSYWAFMYCSEIKDRKEIWNKINDKKVANWYCYCVKDRPEIRRVWDKKFKG